jgi:NAD(P)-dependent dehydrogenase (short-subunit alcohol dehydrogenase family)
LERAVDLIDRPAADAAQTAQAVVDQLGQVDHVVVGINAWIQGEPFWKVSEDAWERTLAITTTYFAPAARRHLTQHRRRPRPRMLNRPGFGGGIDPTEGWSHVSTAEVSA